MILIHYELSAIRKWGMVPASYVAVGGYKQVFTFEFQIFQPSFLLKIFFCSILTHLLENWKDQSHSLRSLWVWESHPPKKQPADFIYT